jgi:hypothetical protein
MTADEAQYVARHNRKGSRKFWLPDIATALGFLVFSKKLL